MLKVDKIQLDIIINNDPARKAMRELDDEARNLTKELKKMTEGSEEYVAKSKRLDEVKAQMQKLRDEIGITGMTLKELKNRQNELNAVLQRMDPRTPMYKEYRAELEQVNARVKELRGTASTAGVSLSGMAEGFNKYFAMATAMAATFTGMVLGVRKCIDAFNEFQAKMANLSALTGLTGQRLNELGEDAKKMSVSTDESGIRITKSAGEIVDAFTKMGSARPELLKNKEALEQVTKQAMILAEASPELGLDGAVQGLANTMNQFNAPAEEAARYINVLAAGSKAGAKEVPYISEAIVKFGVVAKEANVGIEQSVGLIETLGEKGFQAEIAGTGLKTFFTKLLTGADDTNPKIVGLNTALDNLSNKFNGPDGMNRLKDTFGLDNVVIAKSLIDNRANFQNLTTAITGTNVAYEQAKINTDTNAAKLAQAKNKVGLMAIELGEKLSPALTFSTNGLNYFLKALLEVIKFTGEHKTAIVSIIAVIGTYATATYIATNWEKIRVFWTKEGIVATKLKTFWENAGIAATQLYAAATMLLSGNIQGATQAMRIFTATTKLNPWGLLLSVIVAAGAAVYAYSSRLTNAQKIQEAMNSVSAEAGKRLIDEKEKLDDLLKTARDRHKSLEERKKAIEDINKISPDFLSNISLETINTNEAKAAIDEYLVSLDKKLKMEVLQEKIKEEKKKREDIKNSKDSDNVSFWESAWNKTSSFITFGASGAGLAVAAVKDIKTANLNRKEALDESIKIEERYQTEYSSLMKQAETSIKSAEEKASANKKGGAELTEEQKKKLEEQNEWLKKLREENREDRMDEDSKELAALDYKYQEEFKKAKGNAAIIKELEIKRAFEREELNVKQTARRIADDKKESDEALKIKKDTFAKTVAIEEEEYQRDHISIITKFTQKQEQLNAELTAKQLTQEQYDKQSKQAKQGFDTDIESSEVAHLRIMIDLKRNAGEQTIQQEVQLATKLQQIAEKRTKDSNKETDAIVKNRKKQMETAFQQGASAVENAKTFGEATKAILNSVRTAIKAALAEAVAKVVAKELTRVPFPFNIALAAAAGGATAALFNAVVPQFSDGYYPVYGNKDGQRYNAGYGGTPSTGIVNNPTLFLAGEKMPEMIIDGPTFKNMQLNAPHIISAIQGMRVPQYAGGLYKETNTTIRQEQFTDPLLLQTLLMVHQTFKDIKDNGIEANMRYDKYVDSMDEMSKIKSSVTR